MKGAWRKVLSVCIHSPVELLLQEQRLLPVFAKQEKRNRGGWVGSGLKLVCLTWWEWVCNVRASNQLMESFLSLEVYSKILKLFFQLYFKTVRALKWDQVMNMSDICYVPMDSHLYPVFSFVDIFPSFIHGKKKQKQNNWNRVNWCYHLGSLSCEIIFTMFSWHLVSDKHMNRNKEAASLNPDL